jgi:hypothetical protein
MSEQPGEDKRRAIALVLFGSAGLLGLASALVLTGVIGVDGQSSVTVGSIVGGAAVLDALLGAYFLMSS